MGIRRVGANEHILLTQMLECQLCRGAIVPLVIEIFGAANGLYRALATVQSNVFNNSADDARDYIYVTLCQYASQYLVLLVGVCTVLS